MKSLLSLLFMLVTCNLQANDTVCLSSDYQNVFDRLKWSPGEPVVLDAELLTPLKTLIEHDESACFKQMIYRDITRVDMELSSQKWLSKYIEDAATIVKAADQHNALWAILANIADIRFNELMNRLNAAIESGVVDPHTFETRYAIQRLSEQGYTINLRPSLWEKLITYIKDGRWSHIIRSITTTHRVIFYKYAAFLVLAVTISIYCIRLMRKKYILTIKIQQRHENGF